MKSFSATEPMAPDASFQTTAHLIFSFNDALYGVPAHAVREVLALPPITALHELPPLFLGVTHLRDQFLPVADLNRCLGGPLALPATWPFDAPNADVLDVDVPNADVLVVLEFRGSVAAFVVNEVCDVCAIDSQSLRFVSRAESAPSAGSCLAGVARLDGRNLQVLHLPGLFDLIAPFYEQVAATPFTASKDAETEDEWPLVAVVRLGNELFGLSIEWVREFSGLGVVTPIPGCPASVVGLMNLRGEVLSLLDIRSALQVSGAPHDVPQGADEGDAQEDVAPQTAQVVVVECDGWRVGLLVDEVLDIFGLPRHAVTPVLSGEILSGTAWFESQMLSLLDVPKILQQERQVLGES